MEFSVQPECSSWEAQLSTCRDATVVDANGDQLPDLLLAGNYYDSQHPPRAQ